MEESRLIQELNNTIQKEQEANFSIGMKSKVANNQSVLNNPDSPIHNYQTTHHSIIQEVQPKRKEVMKTPNTKLHIIKAQSIPITDRTTRKESPLKIENF